MSRYSPLLLFVAVLLLPFRSLPKLSALSKRFLLDDTLPDSHNDNSQAIHIHMSKKISPRSRWGWSTRRLTLISLPAVAVKRRGKTEEAHKKDIEKRREFDELWAHLPRIQPELRKGRFFSTFQRSSNGSSNIGDAASSNEFACFAAVHGRFEQSRNKLYALKACQIIRTRQIEVLVERINTLRESVATLTQLCPPEVYGPTPSSHDLQKAYASLKVRYAEQAFRISGLLSSTTLSSPHKIDEERRLERCSLLRWQIERENKLIARLNLIIAGCVRRQLPIMLT
ncbi:hypothetical protein Tcan_07924 [Toxocara canis]|uniref:Uncharacterized protein n=1 Tax=Toxocara canis TaxID=6265 RepID=A0A0B2VGE6_TOXCA|nr:hypothetical protein Tcan_07924 [Toxocara canis]